MTEIVFTVHAKTMLEERDIPEEWVWLTIDSPDRSQVGDEGNMHYIKDIEERDGRFLRVVVNESDEPNRIITVFFDRRLGRMK